MIRHIWFGGGLALSLLAGYFLYGQMPQIIDFMTPGVLQQHYILLLRNDFFIAASGYSALTGFLVFFVVFVAQATFDGLQIMTVKARLEGLRDAQLSGTAATAEDLTTAFAEAPELSPHAEAFVATLEDVVENQEQPDGPGFSLRSSVAPQVFFGSDTLVDRSLYLWFFKSLPYLLLGVGVFCFAGSIIGSFERLVDGTTAPEDAQFQLLSAMRTGLIALTISAVTSFLIGLTLRTVLGVRVAQANRIVEVIGSLFPGGAQARYLAAVTQTTGNAAQNIAASITKLSNKLHQDMLKQGEKVLKSTDNLSDSITRKLARAVENSLAKPIAKMTATTRTVTRDQSGQVKKLLEAVLANFVKELEKNFGGQTKEIEKLLKSSSAAVERGEKAFAGAVTGLAEQAKAQATELAGEIGATLRAMQNNEVKRYDRLNTEFGAYTESLRDQVEAHSQRFNELLERMLGEASELTKTALMQSSSDMARTADSFESLHGGLENMVTLILPILHQVIENQESLLASLESDASASKAIGRASSEMSSAAQASRETVERFITLADRLRQVGAAMSAGAAAARHEGQGNSKPPAASKELSRAVKQLRDVVHETAKSLPDLSDDQ